MSYEQIPGWFGFRASDDQGEPVEVIERRSTEELEQRRAQQIHDAQRFGEASSEQP